MNFTKTFIKEMIKKIKKEENNKMTETEEASYSEKIPEKKEKVKKEGTPTWMSKWTTAIKSKDFTEVNFRRKHPRLGSKIGNLEARLRKVEYELKKAENTIENMKNLLSDELKNSIQKKQFYRIEKDWEAWLKTI